MKQPCVLSPGAVQQNPTGQHSESVLKPSLLCKANWICFSGENSTNMENIKYYYTFVGFVSWKYKIFLKGESILLNEVSSSRSRNVGILVVIFA